MSWFLKQDILQYIKTHPWLTVPSEDTSSKEFVAKYRPPHQRASTLPGDFLPLCEPASLSEKWVINS